MQLAKGLHSRRPRSAPLLKENHKKDQLEFTKTHLNKQKYLRDNVLWTDEIKLELFGKTQALYLQEKKC